MDKEKAIEQLDGFKERLRSDVSAAYRQRGSDFGRERFAAWRRQIDKFLDTNLPGARTRLEQKLHRGVFYRGRTETDYDVFMREDGEPCLAFIDSLQLDIRNDEYGFSASTETAKAKAGRRASSPRTEDSNKVFIVHGHDEALKAKAARFVEQLGLSAIILQEQASRGQTIIEKIEANTDVGFAIVLYTPDDLGSSKSEKVPDSLRPRARQNVVFEHGYLIAKLSRAKVIPLVSGKVEIPSDINGVVYVEDTNWLIEIAKEMRAAGYAIDFNKVIGS